MSIHRIKVLSAAILFTTAASIPTLALASFCSPDKAKSKQPVSQYKYQAQQRYAHPYARTYYGYNPYRQSRQQPVNYAYPGYYAKQFYQTRPSYPQRMKQAWTQRPVQKTNPYAAPRSQSKPQAKAPYYWQRQYPSQRTINYTRQPVYQPKAYPQYHAYSRSYPAQNKAKAYYYPGYPKQVTRSYQPPVKHYRPRQAPAPVTYYNWSYTQYQPQTSAWSIQPAHRGQSKAASTPHKIKFDKPKQKPVWQQISITEQGFHPPQIKVKSGDRVFWANMDIESHKITSNNGWQSKSLGRGATYAHTFNKPGIYKYYSSANPRWAGQILVE